MSYDDRITAARGRSNNEVTELTDDVVVKLLDFAEGDSPKPMKVATLGRLNQVLDGVALGSVLDPAALAAGNLPTMSLGAGAPAATELDPEVQDILDRLQALANDTYGGNVGQLVATVANLFAPLVAERDANQRAGRLIAMQEVASGNIPVLNNGSVDVTSALSAIQAELDMERDENDPNSLAGEKKDALDRMSVLENQLREEQDPSHAGSLAHKLATVQDAALAWQHHQASNTLAPITAERDRLQQIVANAMIDLHDLTRAVDSDRVLKRQLNRATPPLRSDFKSALGL